MTWTILGINLIPGEVYYLENPQNWLTHCNSVNLQRKYLKYGYKSYHL